MTEREDIPHQTKAGSVAVDKRLRELNVSQSFAVLATNDNGKVYTSLISFAVTPDLAKLIFATPKNTQKYKNIRSAKDVSLLIDNRSSVRKNLMATEAITLIGTASPLRKSKVKDELAAVFVKKHPELADFIQDGNTALIAVEISRCIHVGKFQTITVQNRS